MAKEVAYGRNGFKIDKKRLDSLIKDITFAATEGHGIFRGGIHAWRRKFLPQWRLPKDMEYEPQRKETADSLLAAQFLWATGIFERQNISRFLMRQTHQVWNNSEKRWFFNPAEVATKQIREIEDIIHNDLKYRLQSTNEQSPAERYLYNAEVLASQYNSDPRLLLNGLKVEEARKRMMKFKGIGTGIANLMIIYFMDRDIAAPLDPEEILFKIDTHKARIPLNCGAVTLANGKREIHTNPLVKSLEQSYKAACKRVSTKPEDTDAAIWIIGSEVCAKRRYSACLKYCPLALNGMCLSNLPLDQQSGTFILERKDGTRAETRGDLKGGHQLPLLEIYRDLQTSM